METNTTTIVETKETTTVETLATETKKEVHYAVFIVFAEFLGYESPLIEWAEEMCNGKDIAQFKKNVLAVEAKQILKKMREKYTLGEIRKWWNEFYTVVLEECETKVKEVDNSFPF